MNTRKRGSRRRCRLATATFPALIAGVVLLAGCGSSGSSSSTASVSNAAATSSSGSSSGDASGVAEAQAFLSAHDTQPTSLNLPPVTKPIPSGKTVTFVHCGVDVCTTIADAIKNAAGILGWQTTVIPSAGTPSTVKAAWDTVVRDHPSVAFDSGFDNSVFASELAQLKATNTPVMEWSVTDSPGNGVALVKGGSNEVGVVGQEMAAWVVTSTHGKANTLYVDLPSYVILEPVKTGFVQAYHQWCSGCQLSTMSVPVTAVGSTAPSLIVSYLRAHPGINRIAVGYDGVDVGLPAALRAAGLSNVQFIGEAPTPTNFSYVQNGEEGATVSQSYYEIWAMFVDAAARQLTGQSLAPDEAYSPPWFVVTKSTPQSADGSGPVPGLDQQLKVIWKK